MRKRTLLWIALPTVLVSCGPESHSPPTGRTKETGAAPATEGGERHTRSATAQDQYLDTRFEYADSTGNRLILENSFPKGRVQDTGDTGKKFVLVFWTRIVNETATPFHVSLAIPADSFLLANAPVRPFDVLAKAPAKLNKPPSLPDNYFKIVFPSEEISPDQAPLVNYGLTDLQPSSTLHRTIKAKTTGFIHVVVLASPGAKGPFRAGFRLKDGRWYYRVNQQEMDFGPANAPSLTLQP